MPERSRVPGPFTQGVGDAKRARIRGGDAIRIIEFPSDADCHSLRRRLRDVLESGQPTGMQKRALGRLVPLLAALR